MHEEEHDGIHLWFYILELRQEDWSFGASLGHTDSFQLA